MNKGIQIVKWTVICVVVVFLFGYVTMLLWNWLVPPVFNGPYLNFWQSLGLLLLSKILFGSFNKCGCGGHSGYDWKSKYYDKLSSMTPEERERFKAKVKEKWCSRDYGSSVGKTDTSND